MDNVKTKNEKKTVTEAQPQEKEKLAALNASVFRLGLFRG